jgi:hypothetical protein
MIGYIYLIFVSEVNIFPMSAQHPSLNRGRSFQFFGLFLFKSNYLKTGPEKSAIPGKHTWDTDRYFRQTIRLFLAL